MIFSNFRWSNELILELSNAKVAYVYYRTTRFNLKTGFPESYPIENFFRRLQGIAIQDHVANPTVFHFYYDLGLIMAGLGHTIDENTPLAVELEYEDKSLKKRPRSRLKSVPLKTLERPTWSEYKVAFQRVQEHLLAGNCYQVNLTYPFDYETESVYDPRDISDFFFSRDNLSAYAHATFLGDEMIVSNSPECLFHYEKNKIATLPIKGTVKVGKNWKEDWAKLQANLKEEGELNMITDLLRNDLNRLEIPRAQVLREKAPLLVPGLLHQCSILSVAIENPLSLFKTLDSLFPGGSVTGAPKKRVMEIIQEVERYSRGIYCGSTLLCLENRKMANINIRTASLSVNDRLWRYGAGGGITLLSKASSEFQEMENKLSSFLTLLKAPGYLVR